MEFDCRGTIFILENIDFLKSDYFDTLLASSNKIKVDIPPNIFGAILNKQYKMETLKEIVFYCNKFGIHGIGEDLNIHFDKILKAHKFISLDHELVDTLLAAARHSIGWQAGIFQQFGCHVCRTHE